MRLSCDEGIADRPKSDAAITQFLDLLDQVVHGATEPIKSPDDERIALLQAGEAGIQTGTLGFRPRNLVSEDVISVDTQAN